MKCPLHNRCHRKQIELGNAMSDALHSMSNDCAAMLAEKDVEIAKLKRELSLSQMKKDTMESLIPMLSANGCKIVSRYQSDPYRTAKVQYPVCGDCDECVTDDSTGRLVRRCLRFTHRVNATRGTCPHHSRLSAKNEVK
jgi:hypothetical protein